MALKKRPLLRTPGKPPVKPKAKPAVNVEGRHVAANSDVRSEKHEKFRALAEQRVSKILERLQLLENLSNRGNYEYSEEEVEKIFETLEQHIAVAKAKFRPKAGSRSVNFKL